MVDALTKALLGLLTKKPDLLEAVIEALLNLLLKDLQNKAKA